jgi:L-2-hydroxyglutarate oxidase LhgO
LLSFRFTVIGAGAAGLSIARSLSQRYRGDNDVLVLERERSFGTGVSSRSSEVIHSGLYYPTGSLKHRLCVTGRRALYQYLDANGIPFRKCGKLVVAAESSEDQALEKLLGQARANGIENVEQLTGGEAKRLEPGLRASSALWVADTGIFDTHAFMKALEAEVIAGNGTVAYGCGVVSIDRCGQAYRLRFGNGERIESRFVINAAGLGAVSVAAMAGLRPEKLHPCKGSYFTYAGSHGVTHLVYPVPEQTMAGLGVHATIDLAGRLRFGPDTEYIDAVDDFAVDWRKRAAFADAARKLFPGIEPDLLQPDQAGIRPKIQGPGDTEVKDFYIREESAHGFPGFADLIGIESPGLTASLAIGEHVCGNLLRLEDDLSALSA